MSEFVQECRREWKRLRVPDAVADEMAADLAADLEEAEADGATPEEVLGIAASDPRAFAASWASERGLVQDRLSAPVLRRPIVLAGTALLVVVIAAVVTVAIIASSDGGRRSTVATPAAHVVPYLVGLETRNAVLLAQARGLSVRVTVRNSTAHEAGTVIAQSPAAGAHISPGAALQLVVAR